MNKSKSKAADIWFFPPYLLWSSLIISAVLEVFVESLIIFEGSIIQFTSGMLIVMLSVINFFYTYLTFLNNKEEVHPRSITTQIFTGGTFKYSRNPIYLSFVLMLAGCGIAFNSFWYVYLSAINVLLLHYGIILPEEKYLEKEFGTVYLEYKKSVRRWL
jgi:protein-S-isoprenylcysteine O-methyltransferase Ste14